MEDNFMDFLYDGDETASFGFDPQEEMISEDLTPVGDPYSSGESWEYIDSDNNGVVDMAIADIDVDGDGYAETLLIGQDYDQDGTLDHIKLYSDIDLDGDFEVFSRLHADTSGGELVYRYETDVDFDGDHISDQHEEGILTAQELGLEPMYDYAYTGAFLGSPDINGQFDPNTPPEVVAGDPASAMEVWECQGNTNRCALYSQKFVIEQLTDLDIDIEEFADIAKENGWFTEEGGTAFLNMNKMLEYYGIDHEVVFDSDMSQLEEELRDGNKIIVSVDSGQIWPSGPNDIFSPMTNSDHAIEVIGIDYSDPSNPMVVLNDSGTPDGRGEMVPLDVFENAWGAGDHQMIVCSA